VPSLIKVIFSQLIFVFVIYIVLAHPSGNRAPLINISPRMALIAAVILVVVGCISNIIWFKNYSFSFAPDMVVLKTRVIASQETHVPYRTIQDVVMTQGILERLLGIATVTIQNATAAQSGRRTRGGTKLIGQPVAKANELVTLVRSIIVQTNPIGTGL
jgi:membrane protein YdbS with pleckstrin-like domain